MGRHSKLKQQRKQPFLSASWRYPLERALPGLKCNQIMQVSVGRLLDRSELIDIKAWAKKIGVPVAFSLEEKESSVFLFKSNQVMQSWLAGGSGLVGCGEKSKQSSKQQKTSTWCERRTGKTPLGNFGVFCAQTGFLVDSAATPEEADKLCEYINQRLKKHPLINPSNIQWFEWIRKNQEWTPDANVMSTDLDRLKKDSGGLDGDLVLHSEFMDSLSES